MTIKNQKKRSEMMEAVIERERLLTIRKTIQAVIGLTFSIAGVVILIFIDWRIAIGVFLLVWGALIKFDDRLIVNR